jgi:hypothetical protein
VYTKKEGLISLLNVLNREENMHAIPIISPQTRRTEAKLITERCTQTRVVSGRDDGNSK